MRYLSTHDLTKRSTPFIRITPYLVYSFNSRPHEEVDGSVSRTLQEGNLSTHDLTKRSTLLKVGLRLLLQIFQLTTSRRGRPGSFQILCTPKSFQLTTSRRGRLLRRSHGFSLQTVFQLTTSRRGRRSQSEQIKER